MSDLVTIRPGKASRLRQIAVISGKGGTGKTSLVGSFAALAGNSVLADCDVDASDLHLLLEPRIVRREQFTGGKRAHIKAEQCTECGKCTELCRFAAISVDGNTFAPDDMPGNQAMEKTFRVDALACEGCGVCAWFCPENAIELCPVVNGEWFISETRFGPMVHAKLGVAGENSGKLVTRVRTNAERIAEENGLDLLLIDGSPGIGCPVIASITGVDLVLIVTEPTVSGLHDLERVARLARHFSIPCMFCINKWDLNTTVSDRIEARARQLGLALAGTVRYDRAITEAQIQRKTLVEYQQNGCAADIRELWASVKTNLMKVAGTINGPLAKPATAGI